MPFNSLFFLVFFAVFICLYMVTRGRTQLLMTLLFSWLFYAAWDWRFLGLIWFSTLLDYGVGRFLGVVESPRRRRAGLIVCLCGNLGVLGFFKYFNFFLDSAVNALAALGISAHPTTLSIILPVGISFFTFQTMSYSIDVYRREMEPERSFLIFATYVALFPQLVAGPIVRARDLLPQLRGERLVLWSNLGRGIELVLWGYVLKLCLADNFAPFVDQVFAAPGAASPETLLLGLLGFSFQIYGDFAGYSLIAIGIGRMLGLDFGRNFDAPYFAASFSGFWQRWHISLSSWLRDYLYIPLGGNRHGAAKTLRNLILTMLLGGLWHGASWMFVLWGALHGTYLALERLVSPTYHAVCNAIRLPASLRRVPTCMCVFTLTVAAWLPFRAENWETLRVMAGRMVDWGQYDWGMGDFIPIAMALAVTVIVVGVDALGRSQGIRNWYADTLIARVTACYSMLFLILFTGVFEGSRFIYFQF